MGDGGGGGDGMSDSLSTHLDPTPFRPGPPLHTLGWTRNVAFVPFASVSSVSTAVEHGNPASAPKEVLCPRSSFEVVKHSSHSSKQRNPVVSHESSSNSYSALPANVSGQLSDADFPPYSAGGRKTPTRSPSTRRCD